MNMTSTSNATSATNYQIGTFHLEEADCAVATAALEIAKRMAEVANDPEADIARAVILIAGAGLAHGLGGNIYGVDEADVDRQIVAYMDGVAELQARFPWGGNAACECGSHKGC